MNKQNDKIQVRLCLEGDLLEKANALREYYGIQMYAELVRFLINEQYRNIEGKL